MFAPNLNPDDDSFNINLQVRELWFGPKVKGVRSLPPGQSWRVVLEAMTQDWMTPELVWNAQTRRELAMALENEVRAGRGQLYIPTVTGARLLDPGATPG